jgi:hypothetical protein
VGCWEKPLVWRSRRRRTFDPDGGGNADATADGGPDLPDDIEPDLKDVGTAQLLAGRDNDDH